MKKKVIIYSGLVFVDRFLIFSNFLDSYKNKHKEYFEITIYTKVENNLALISKLKPELNGILKLTTLTDSFKFYRITSFFRQLTDLFFDLSVEGSKTRRYFYKEMNLVPILFKNYFIKFFLKFNSKSLRSMLSELTKKIHLLLIKNEERIISQLSEADVVFLCWPYNIHNQSIAALCTKLNKPFYYLVAGFDNITTKPRYIFKPSGILFWGEKNRQEFERFYPTWTDVSKTLIGNINFELLLEERFLPKNKNTFLSSIGFSENKKIIVWGLGSPNLFNEFDNLLSFINNCGKELSEKIQIIVRPHPAFEKNFNFQLLQEISLTKGITTYYQLSNDLIEADYQDASSIEEWCMTVRYADVIINTTSTFGIEGMLFGKEIININYDISGNPNNFKIIKASNELWEHYKWIVETKAMIKVDSESQLNETLTMMLRERICSQNDQKFILKKLCNYPSNQLPSEVLLSSISKSLKINQYD